MKVSVTISSYSQSSIAVYMRNILLCICDLYSFIQQIFTNTCAKHYSETKVPALLELKLQVEEWRGRQAMQKYINMEITSC